MPDGGPFGPASVVVFGLFSAIAWGAGDFGGGLVGRRIHVLTLVLGTQVTGMVVALSLWRLLGEAPPGPADVAWAALAGVLGAAGILALYAALAAGRMGIVAPVSGVLAAAVPVAVGIVLDGLPSPLVLVGMLAAAGAVVLVSRVAGGPAGTGSGLRLALAAGFGIGLFNVAITRTDDAIVFGSLVVARLTSALAVLAVLAAGRRRPAAPRSLAPAILAIGVLDMAGNAGFLLAAQTGPLSVAAVLSSLYPVTTVVLAGLLLRERVDRGHAAGILLALVAIVLIASGSA